MRATREKLGVYPASHKSSVLSITGKKITFASTTFLYPHEKCDLLRSFTMIHCLSNLNAEFQRIARRHKKAFLSDQCKEIKENNRMGKTSNLFKKIRDLFKKIRDNKGTFHAKMGQIKDINGMSQQKQKILRRGGRNTQKNCTKQIFTTKIITIV